MALINEFLNDAKLSNRSYDAKIEEIATSLDIGLHGAGVLVSDVLELVKHGSSREQASGSPEMSMRLHGILIYLGELGGLVDHLGEALKATASTRQPFRDRSKAL